MRTRLIVLIAAFVLASRAGFAQPPQPPPPASAPAQPAAGAEGEGLYGVRGTFDIGGLFTSTDGDEARYERYRDLRDGLFTNLRFNRNTDTYLFDASVLHAGYRDQRYRAKFRGSRFDFNAALTSNPLNFSYLTRTPFVTSGSVLTLDDNAQRTVQGPTFANNDGQVGVPCAPGGPPAACSNATQAAQAKANRSIYNGLALPFDLRYTRHVTAADVRFDATTNVDVDAAFASTKRSGAQPWGASFAFNTAVEVPKPLDERTNDVRVGANWANDQSSFRVGWDGSWFNNQFHELVWDNPILLTDFTNGLLPPNGPYDPNGYSNGNGPGRGREATAPDNSMHVFSAVGLHKLSRRSTINGTMQFTTQNQNETLIPWTINSVINNTPAVIAAFPKLAQNPRATAEAKATGVNTLINFNTRPYRMVGVTVRYRYNKRNVQTPIFDATEYVRFDAVPEEIEEGFSPQFDNSRHYFDANAAFTPAGWGTLRVGYGHEGIARRGRGFADVGEHIFRMSYDAYSNQWVNVRASFDIGRRRGEGFVEAESGNDEEEVIVGPGGTQPTLRYYDEADRDRKRGMVVVNVMPRDTVDLFFQATIGRDTFLPDDSVPVSRPGELFGLQEQNTGNWNIGVNYHPTDVLSAGASFGRDTFGSLQRSRNANPPPDPTWFDPSRDWTMDNDDKIRTASVYLDLIKAVKDTDVRFVYDFSDSDNSFVHGGPRIATLTTANQFIALPNVTNTWHRATADVQHFFTSRAGVAVGYHFEKLDVADYNTIDTNGPVGFTDATGEPRIDWLGALMTGYGNRPYKGQTVFVRVLYKF
jgi:hypothetical protein